MTAVRPFLFSAALAAVLLQVPAAADDARMAEIEARYQRERSACEQAQDKPACLREAAAAREAARRGVLDTGQGSFERNALARCANLPVEERDACVRRTRDEGVTQGSVGEGGIIREYREYTLPSQQAPSAPPR